MKKIFTSTLIIIISIFIISSIVSAATTISTEISTGGSLTVVGTSTLATTTFSGNVGIGTAATAYLLDLKATAGNIAFFKIQNADYSGNTGTALTVITGTSSGNSYVRFQAFNDGGSSAGNIALNSSGGNVGIGSTTPYAKLSVKGGGTTTGVNFQTTNSSNSPLFTILDSGSVGIGTTTPTTQLQVTNSASNATTTLTIGKVGQNKGTCHEEFRSDGAVIYWWWTPTGAMATSSSSCK